MASQELRAFLSSIESRYVDHADAIHKGEFTNQAELASADRTDLEKLGIPKDAAGLIIAAAGGKGAGSQDVRSIIQEVITELLDGPTMSRILKLAVAKYKGRLYINPSGAGSFTMQEVAARLGLTVERARTVPCCLELQESIPTPPPYTWRHHEAHVEEVRRGQTWLQDVVCTGNLKTIAVTSQTWLRAIWAEEEVEITNCKADYIFADAGAAEKLPELPAQPSEAQLLELLKHIKGLYEAKPTKHVQEKGILSLWSQMFAEFLAITWMLDHEAGVKKSIPVFGGDFNDHMIMHQPSSHVLHFMKHDPDDAGKQCAVACMRHLLNQDNVLHLETGDDDEMGVDPLQMARPGSSDAVVDAKGGHASSSTDEHSRIVQMSDDVQSESYSFNLQQMDAVFHEVVLRRLRSPVGYESLGKNKPPLQVEHSSFSDYVKSLKIVG